MTEPVAAPLGPVELMVVSLAPGGPSTELLDALAGSWSLAPCGCSTSSS